MLADQVERPILPLFSLVDIRHRLLIHRNGRLTLVYRVTAFHEPALDDPEFEHLALQLTHTWSALPEGVSYQFLTVVDAGAAASILPHLFRPVPPISERHELYEAIREENLKRFTSLALGADAGRELLQARQHYLCVSFEPEGLKKHRRARILRWHALGPIRWIQLHLAGQQPLPIGLGLQPQYAPGPGRLSRPWRADLRV